MKTMGSFRYQWDVNLLGRTILPLGMWVRTQVARYGWRSENLAPPLKVSWKNKELVARHWLEGRYANQYRKVAWVTSGAPAELLKALDFYVFYPENHAAVCGAGRVAVDIASEAEEVGFSRDICSYARTDLGSLFSGRTPVGKIPKPDLLLACTNICQTVLFWYRVLARYFSVPLIVIDTPFVYHSEAKKHAVEFVKRQLEEAIPVAESVAGKSLDQRKLDKVTRLSKSAAELWLEILERNKNQPAPISVIDQFIQMAPIVEMRGDATTVDFYAAMLSEVDERITKGIGAVKGERKRLLWDNLPIWYRLRYLAEFLGNDGIAIVTSTYTNAWGELAPLYEPEMGLESIARVCTYVILNRGTGHKLATMQRMIEAYQLDGVILHSDRSCKPYSVGQMDQRDRLIQEYRTPALLLEADHNDHRCFAEEQVANRLAAFIEMLER